MGTEQHQQVSRSIVRSYQNSSYFQQISAQGVEIYKVYIHMLIS
jgi:hypothetical protein